MIDVFHPYEDGIKMLQYLVDGILPGFGLPKVRTATSNGWRWDVVKLQLYYYTHQVILPPGVNNRSVISVRWNEDSPVVLLDNYMEYLDFYFDYRKNGTRCENLELYLTE